MAVLLCTVWGRRRGYGAHDVPVFCVRSADARGVSPDVQSPSPQPYHCYFYVSLSFRFFIRFILFYLYFLMGECHRLIPCLCLCYFDVDRCDFNIYVYFSSVTSHFLQF